MRAVLQRVRRASVEVDEAIVGQIGVGWLVLLGVARGDTNDDATWMADKIARLRAFEDDDGKMNRSVADVSGGVLVVSQFTLLADCRTGRRPSFTAAAVNLSRSASPSDGLGAISTSFWLRRWALHSRSKA